MTARRDRFRLLRCEAVVAAGACAGILLLTGAGCGTNHTAQSVVITKMAQTQLKMAQIHLGMSEDSVKSILGDPDPNLVAPLQTGRYRQECWAYVGKTASWQLCFDNGMATPHAMVLVSKKRLS